MQPSYGPTNVRDQSEERWRSHLQTKIVPVIFETLSCPDIIWNSAILLFIRPTVHIFIHSRLHLSFSATLSIQKPSRKIRAAGIRVSQRVLLRNRLQHSTPYVIVTKYPLFKKPSRSRQETYALFNTCCPHCTSVWNADETVF